MAHSHEHNHNTGEIRLLWSVVLTGIFMVAEVGGGIISGSLALLADAGHMLTDFSALLLALIASRIARKPADILRSYGYHRAQILAAFFNGIAFFGIVFWILIEAIQRVLNPEVVAGGTMLVIAGLGLIVNILVFFILHSSGQQDLNIRAAIVHVLGDLLGSAAAIVAAVIIIYTNWYPIDPILSVFVALLVLRSAWFVVRQSVHILLEGTPEDVDVQLLRKTLSDSIEEIIDVHHVHVWSLSAQHPLLTAHIRVTDSADYNSVLQRTKQVLAERFGIDHATIQIEYKYCEDRNI